MRRQNGSCCSNGQYWSTRQYGLEQCFLFRKKIQRNLFILLYHQKFKLSRRSHLQKFHKKLVVLKISKNPQKIKYIAITDVKKLILILLKCYNSVLPENELLNRYLAKNLYRFSKPLFSRTPDVGVVRLRGVIKMCFVPRLIKL